MKVHFDQDLLWCMMICGGMVMQFSDRVYAALDLGSNSFHLVIAKVENDRLFFSIVSNWLCVLPMD